MTFVSSDNTRWIEQLQAHICNNLPSNETSLRFYLAKKKVFTTSDLLHIYYFTSKMGEVDLKEEAFSRYEHPKSREMLALLDARFWRIIGHLQPSGEGFRIRENVTLGCLPLGYHNALTTKGPTGDYIILLNDGLFPLVRCFSEAFAMSLEDRGSSFFIPSGESLKAAIANQPIVKMLGDAFLDYLITGSVEGHGSGEIYAESERERFSIASCMVHSMMMLVLAHEYAHVFLGHLDTEQAGRSTCESLDMKKRWGQELSCDVFATGVTVFYDNYHQQKGVSLSSLGINLFFLIEKLFHPPLHDTTKAHSEPHPPSHVRQEVCLRKIYSLVSYPDYSATVDVWNDMTLLFHGWRSAFKLPFSDPEDLDAFLDRKERRGRAIVKLVEDLASGRLKRDEGGPRVILY